jgi:hypothetical protein
MLKPTTVMKWFKYWPPFLSSGISVKEFNLDEGFVVSQLKPSLWNVNYFKTLYGGSLYSMCDPFYVFILAHKLGKTYYIWDLKSEISFLKATGKKVTAKFLVTQEQVEDIIKKAESGNRVEPVFVTQIIDSDLQIVAEVKKTLYVKRKPLKTQVTE